jgi:hypothetical protein
MHTTFGFYHKEERLFSLATEGEAVASEFRILKWKDFIWVKPIWP